MNKYEKILTAWCDKLIELQVTQIKDKNFYGGILCPACAMIHGRIADAVYPFICLYDRTGDEKYLNAALLVIEWSENNVKRPSGAYFNDKCADWKGISAFTALAFGDTLLHHDKCLPENVRAQFWHLYERLTEAVYVYFESPEFRPNINYHVAESALMAQAYVLLGNEKYKEKAYEKFEYSKAHFNEEHFLFGEGPVTKTKKGLYYVDIGYNVEESLPLLMKFAHYMQDKEALSFVTDSIKTHLEFILPDGAIDNSFGSRANKWTYWGSRTSDGMQEGLCLSDDPMFAEAAERNFDLLEKCSKDGFLYGGLMYIEGKEEPCVHHAFCHAKALATMLDEEFCHTEKVNLPRDAAYGLKTFKTLGVHLIAKGEYRATVSDTDMVCNPQSAVSGGTMSMLWHKKTGPLFSATMPKYATSEPRNMQMSRYDDVMENIAVRISCGAFESVNAMDAEAKIKEQDDKIFYQVSGNLQDLSYAGDIPYELSYVFEEDTITVTAKAGADGVLKVPVICGYSDSLTPTETGIELLKNGYKVTLEGAFEPTDLQIRKFHVIGGFLTAPLAIKLKADEAAQLKIRL